MLAGCWHYAAGKRRMQIGEDRTSRLHDDWRGRQLQVVVPLCFVLLPRVELFRGGAGQHRLHLRHHGPEIMLHECTGCVRVCAL
jgi:hypothetical protein